MRLQSIVDVSCLGGLPACGVIVCTAVVAAVPLCTRVWEFFVGKNASNHPALLLLHGLLCVLRINSARGKLLRTFSLLESVGQCHWHRSTWHVVQPCDCDLPSIRMCAKGWAPPCTLHRMCTYPICSGWVAAWVAALEQGGSVQCKATPV